MIPTAFTLRLCGQTILLLLGLANNIYGCLALSDKGFVGINNETVVIIWDKTHNTEHFIRTVMLDSRADKAGFLVPTPSTPELGLADSRLFDLPDKYLPMPRTLSVTLSKSVPASNTDGIEPRVVAEEQMGDYHAVILDASDSRGLGNWLRKNGYPWTESSALWLAPYLAKKWKVTAFKLQRSETGEIGTTAIRMSFTTEHPFFPYREPAEASKLGGPQRVLRIAFLSDDRVVGKLEDGSDWSARLDYAGSTTPASYSRVDKNDWLKFAGLAGKADFTLPSRLTYFSDYSNPRPGKFDLFFSSSADQSNFSP